MVINKAIAHLSWTPKFTLGTMVFSMFKIVEIEDFFYRKWALGAPPPPPPPLFQSDVLLATWHGSFAETQTSPRPESARTFCPLGTASPIYTVD